MRFVFALLLAGCSVKHEVRLQHADDYDACENVCRSLGYTAYRVKARKCQCSYGGTVANGF